MCRMCGPHIDDAVRSAFSIRTVLVHPFSTLEYAIVPMVFRGLKIADELASSAIVVPSLQAFAAWFK